MRTAHFDALKPVCPRCLAAGAGAHPVIIASVWLGDDDTVTEGTLHCSYAGCQQEYPVIDGIPLLVANVRQFVADNIAHLTARDDLGAGLSSILGDCAGPGSSYDTTRQHLSTYAWDAYGDRDPDEVEPRNDAPELAPGAIVRCVASALELAGDAPSGPVLDLGCGVGRSAFELAARTGETVLGIDIHLAMLRLASGILRNGRVRYPRRRIGLVYDERHFDVEFEAAERVDFWACDALNLPFADGSFGLVAGFNLIDCTASPRDALMNMRRMLATDGRAVLTTPYDWSINATPVETWIGGHSQRGPDAGAAEPLIEALLTPGAHPQSVSGLELVAQRRHFPWQARLHDRSTMRYDVHMVAARTG